MAFAVPKEFDKLQKQIWQKLNQFLSENGVLSAEITGRYYYCVLVKLRENCRKKVEELGEVVQYTNKVNATNPVQSPWLISYRGITKAMENIERQLGMGVLNRDRVNWKSKD